MHEVSEQIRSTFYLLEDSSTNSSNGFLNEVEQRIQEVTFTFALHQLDQQQSVPSTSIASHSPTRSSLYPTISISSDEIHLPHLFLAVPSFPSPTPSTAPTSYYSGSDLEEEHLAGPLPKPWDFANPASPLPGRPSGSASRQPLICNQSQF